MAKFCLPLFWLNFMQVIDFKYYLYLVMNFHEICKNWLSLHLYFFYNCFTIYE